MIQVALRGFFVAGTLIFLFLNSYTLYKKGLQFKPVDFKDQSVIKYSGFLFKFFMNNANLREQILNLLMAQVDLITFACLFKFVRYTSSWRFAICYMIFQAFRGIQSHIFLQKTPKGFGKLFTGVMGIFVHNAQSLDFFYVTLIGVTLIYYLEFDSSGWIFWSYFSLSSLVIQVLSLLFVRSHITMDLILVLITANFFFIISEKYSYLVDVYIFGIPLSKRLGSHLSMENQNQDYG